jgi:hypothetical protein
MCARQIISDSLSGTPDVESSREGSSRPGMPGMRHDFPLKPALGEPVTYLNLLGKSECVPAARDIGCAALLLFPFHSIT